MRWQQVWVVDGFLDKAKRKKFIVLLQSTRLQQRVTTFMFPMAPPTPPPNQTALWNLPPLNQWISQKNQNFGHMQSILFFMSYSVDCLQLQLASKSMLEKLNLAPVDLKRPFQKSGYSVMISKYPRDNSFELVSGSQRIIWPWIYCVFSSVICPSDLDLYLEIVSVSHLKVFELTHFENVSTWVQFWKTRAKGPRMSENLKVQ